MAATVFALAGCAATTSGVGHVSVSQGPSRFPSSTSSPPATATPTIPTSGTVTRAQLRRVLVQPGDLPAGWTSKPPSSDDSPGEQRMLARCLGVPNADPGSQAKASLDYTLDHQEIDSDGEAYRRPADVATQLAILRNPRLTSCFRAEFRHDSTASLPAGETLAGVRATLHRGSQGVSRSVVAVLGVVLTLRVSGTAVSVYDDAWFLVGRRITVTLGFTSVGVPFDPAAERQLASALADRIGG